MLTKLSLESFLRATDFFSNIFVFPFNISVKTGRSKLSVRIVQSRWRYTIYQIITLVVLPIQLIDVYYNIIREALKVKQASANLKCLIFSLFYTAIATLGVVLNFHFVVKMDMFKQIMSRLVSVDEYLAGKLH